MSTPSVHQDDGGRILRALDGFVLILWGSHGANTILLIRSDGAMIDTTGEPVEQFELNAARVYLSFVGGERLANKLHQGTFDKKRAAQAVAAIKQ